MEWIKVRYWKVRLWWALIKYEEFTFAVAREAHSRGDFETIRQLIAQAEKLSRKVQ